MASQKTMKALVFYGPFDVRLEDRPVPKIIEPDDVIIKTTSAGLCGSELHRYRGHSKLGMEPGYICGHEGVGIISEVGPAVKKFKVGDWVIAPFTISCGVCHHCKRGVTARCVKVKSFGGPELDGSQAEYFRAPLADAFLVPAPDDLGELLILMSDIYPTGFHGARNAFKESPAVEWPTMDLAIIGLGPVGICGLLSALEYKPKRIFAIDGVEDRLNRAQKLGAIPLNFRTQNVKEEIMKATDGNGVDAVIEYVGLSPALRTAFEIIRPGGKISSVGVHNAEIPFTAADGYNRNVFIQFGRCSVRTVFDDSLASLRRNIEKVQDFIDVIIPLDESFAPALEKFEKNQVNKVVYKPNGMHPTL
ncbi:GroES-like protein [Rhizodiscina lignyota]|uniref:GroES-like protein n=1 Tax=Rhizodiscina lignyota TaxID=1504668 RepID=A0A9P4M466_9PEZI|nr:GroES-like protein [Rhizodiscina lignyota]